MRAAFVPFARRALRAGAFVALALVCAATSATAQSAKTEHAMAARRTFLADLDALQSKFVALAEAIPAEKYSWRPAPGVRSIGEAFQHVASEYYTYSPIAFGAAPSPVIGRGPEAFQKFESASTKPDVLKHLKEGFAYGRQAIAAVDSTTLAGTIKWFGRDLPTAETSYSMSGDLHEHLGQLIAYARMNGVKPPWTK